VDFSKTIIIQRSKLEFYLFHPPSSCLTLQAVPESISFISSLLVFPFSDSRRSRTRVVKPKSQPKKPSQNGFVEVSFVNYHWQNVPV
jgi:hypothetical protein